MFLKKNPQIHKVQGLLQTHWSWTYFIFCRTETLLLTKSEKAAAAPEQMHVKRPRSSLERRLYAQWYQIWHIRSSQELALAIEIHWAPKKNIYRSWASTIGLVINISFIQLISTKNAPASNPDDFLYRSYSDRQRGKRASSRLHSGNTNCCLRPRRHCSSLRPFYFALQVQLM